MQQKKARVFAFLLFLLIVLISFSANAIKGVKASPMIATEDANSALVELLELEKKTHAILTSSAVVDPAPRVVRPPKRVKNNLGYPDSFIRAQPLAVAQIEARFAERRKSMRCIPKNTELIQQDPDGDVYLFVLAGVDVEDLKRCFPKHGFDAHMTAHNNNASSIIPYYLEDATKPARGNNLRFHQGRWNIKKSQWKESGRVFYADWFKEHKDKKFGFALQAGQKIFLRMADTWVTDNSIEAGPSMNKNDTKLKQGHNQVPIEFVPEIVEKNIRYSFARNTAINGFNSHDFMSTPRIIFEKISMSYWNFNRVGNLTESIDQGVTAIVNVINLPSTIKQQNWSMKNWPMNRVCIRAGSYGNQVLRISQERYCQKNDGADMNKNLDDVRLRMQQEKLLPGGCHGVSIFDYKLAMVSIKKYFNLSLMRNQRFFYTIKEKHRRD